MIPATLLARTDDDALNRLYQGQRETSGAVLVTVNGQPLPHIVRHSPDGFEWGYGGSGPADLALALLADATTERLARLYYQDYKREVVALLPHGGWSLTRHTIRAWVQRRVAAEIVASRSAHTERPWSNEL